MDRRFTNAVAALDTMLDLADRAPDRKTVRIRPDYKAMTESAQLAAFRRLMEDAATKGAVTLAWERDPDAPDALRSVTLRDADALAAFLGRARAAVAADAAGRKLEETLRAAPAWVRALMTEVAEAWRIKRSPLPGLEVNDTDRAARLVALLSAMERDEHLGLDMRTFSRRACGDSKAAERLRGALAAALRRRHPDLAPAPPREVLAALGLEKFPQPVLVRGRLRLPDGTPLVAEPFVGLPAEWAAAATLEAVPPYVLTIENLASFNRHAREVRDGGLIVLSNGFPSRTTLAFLQRLDAQLPAEVPFLHWGDVDAGGLRILRHLASSLTRPLHPHHTPLDDGWARTIDDVARYLDRSDPVMVEQEELDPVGPAGLERVPSYETSYGQ